MKRKLGILLGISLLVSVAFLSAQNAYASKGETWEITGGESTVKNENKEIAAAFEAGELNTVVYEPTPAVQKQNTEPDDKAEKNTDVWEVRSVSAEEKNLPSHVGYQIQSREDISEPRFQTEASYVERLLSYAHELNVDGELVAWVEEDCTVWFYTDGKVHLYRRVLTLHVVDAAFNSSYITYGQMINTDGSFSYTSGDMLTFSNGKRSQTYALEFYVTPAAYRFWLSEK